jgi:signal transduction histidine kinase
VQEFWQVVERRQQGQKQAFEAAVSGAPIERSLGHLIRIALDEIPDSRAGFFLVDEDQRCLHPIAVAEGMPETYTRNVEGLKVSETSFACGLAAAIKRPIITPDVETAAIWKPWLSIAREFCFRACWSFPIHTATGRAIGTFALYHRQPREATKRDLELADIITHAAAIIISHHTETQERKRAEDALRAQQQTLEQQVRERTERLRTADRMAAVGTLASGLAHDMSNLLAPLSMQLDMLVASKQHDAETHNELMVVSALLDHLRSLTKNLALFSRDPQKEGIVGRVHVGQWCSSVHKLLNASVGREIKMHWDCPDDLPEVAIAPHRLTQAVQNLIHNARDAVLTAKSKQVQNWPRIAVECRVKDSSSINIRVIDNGIGMDEETLRRCIEPFFTTRDRPTEAGAGGSGLGMSLAHQIAEGAGGSMFIESKPGVGTTVCLTLPIAASVTAEASRSA